MLETSTDIEITENNIETICCDGGDNELGHPAVYYSFDDKKEIVCSYCGKKYIKENKNIKD